MTGPRDFNDVLETYSEELKEFLDSVTLREQASAEQEVADANQAVLNKAPLGIYIG
mgnify:CR=1 FL=1